MKTPSDKTKLARLERLQLGGLPSYWATQMAYDHMPGLNREGKAAPIERASVLHKRSRR